ncbi:MAG: 50S ribosomal protein L24 [Planctomycetes bacterium]|nr:50S ribosomal protein L24 [Planctomycetota bacterium]
MVISGNDRGNKGEIVRIDRARGRVVVKGVNMHWRHIKKNPKNPQGGRVQREASVHISNVLLFDEKSNRGVRIRHQEKNGKKVRISAKSGSVLEAK